MKNGFIGTLAVAALMTLGAPSQTRAGAGIAFTGHTSASGGRGVGGGGVGTVFTPSYSYGEYGGYYPYGSAFPNANSNYAEPGGSDLDTSNYDGTTWLSMEVQQALAREGYYDGPADGVVGTDTHVAISSYQQEHRLPITGTINMRLLIALGLRQQ
jgi:peptidoglycan hydrolase-like protein with peptidoglycan-binding domain